MMRTILMVAMLVVAPTMAAAQINTTGSLAPNTAVIQAQAPATGTTTPGATTTTPATTVPAARDAVIVLCAQDFSTGTGRLLIFSSSSSAGAPTIAPGAGCAQALSDLFVAGFGVIDVQPFNQQLQYTLVR